MTCQDKRNGSLATAAAALLSVGGVSLSATRAQAATITVNTTNMAYANDSACGLPEAIVAVNKAKAFDGCPAGNGKNDTVVVPAGTYTAQSGAPLAITASVTIQGAGNLAGVGVEAGLPVQTTIVGDSLTASAHGLFTVSDAARPVSVTFQGLVLEMSPPSSVPISGINGSASQFGASTITVSGSFIYGFGLSGISLYDFSLDLVNSHLSNNYNCVSTCGDYGAGGGSGSGGGIAITGGGALTVSNSTIEQNVSDANGGGIYSSVSKTSVINSSTISDNLASAQASGGTGGSGGGIYLTGNGGAVTIAGSTVAFNTAYSDGGGLVAFGNFGDTPTTFTMVDSILSNNTSIPDYYEDDDLESDGSLTVKSSLVLEYYPENGEFLDGGNNIGFQDPNLDILPTPRGGPYNLPLHTFTIVARNPTGGVSGSAYEETVLSPSPAVDYLVALDAPTSGNDELGTPRGLSQFGGFGKANSPRFDLGAYEFDPHVQAESMVVAKYSGPAPTVYSDSNALNGKGLAFAATKAGQYATVVFTSPRDGCYHVWVRALTGNAQGQFQVNYSVDLSGSPTAYSPWGSRQDTYSTKGGYQTFDLGYMNANLIIGNNYYFQFMVPGKNPNSKGFALDIDTVDVLFETSSNCGT